jgi:cell division septum initiation protein DivIVA
MENRGHVSGVFDFNAITLMEYVSEMNEEHFKDAPVCFGGALNYNRGNLEVEIKRMEKKIAAGKQEREALTDSWEIYTAAKQEAVLNTAQESQLIMEEIAAFAPIALKLAERTLQPLQDAQLLGMGITEVKSEMLNQAVQDAIRLREILSIMPEGCADIGGFLQNPNGFLYATAAAFGHQNRLNLAVAQVLRVVNQLRTLLGE